MLVLHSGEAQVPVTPKRPSDRPIIQNEGGGRTDALEEVVYGLDYIFIIIVQCSNIVQDTQGFPGQTPVIPLGND